MQSLKDEVRQRILVAAHDEFIARGVKNTPMRAVAERAGIAVGNVYNYFGSKDALFREVMRPLLSALNRYVLSHNEECYLNIEVFSENRFQTRHMLEMKTLIVNFRPELQLLLFKADGTSLANYKDRILEHQMDIGIEYLHLMKRRYPHININISPFLLRIATATWVSIFTELVRHDEYSDAEIDYALQQCAAYSMAGWKELLNV